MTEPLIDEKAQELLVEEYKANISLFIHADNIRQTRIKNLLATNAILFAGLGVAYGAEEFGSRDALVFLISVVGIFTAAIWFVAQSRNSAFLDFRRHQLREIEARLGGVISTYSNAYATFSESTFRFPTSGETISVKKMVRIASTLTEGSLPLLSFLLWLTLLTVHFASLVIL